MCKIIFNFDQVAEITSEDDLNDFLLSVREHYEPPNPIFMMIHQSGNMLYLGISSKGCHVVYKDASLNPPYYSSAGAKSNKNKHGYVEYMMSKENHVTEIRKSKTISFNDLVKITMSFYRMGTRPVNTIEWQID